MEPVVRLQRLSPDDLETFISWRLRAREEDPYGYFGERPQSALRQRYADNELLSPDDGVLMVVLDDGTVVGEVGWHSVDYGPPPGSTAYNIGIGLVPEHRGRGYGAVAQRLLAEYLLATYPVNRVEASTDVTNIAEQRALEKAGFTREGILRGAQWRAGEWHDLVGYSFVRSDLTRSGLTPSGVTPA